MGIDRDYIGPEEIAATGRNLARERLESRRRTRNLAIIVAMFVVELLVLAATR